MGNVHFFPKFIVTVIMVCIIIHNSLLLHRPPSVPFQRTLPFYILFSSDVGILSFPKAAFNDKRGRREDTIRPKAAGMLFPLDWNVSPWPGHKAQFSAGPPGDKNPPGDALCEPLVISASRAHLLAGSRLESGSERLPPWHLLLITVIKAQPFV